VLLEEYEIRTGKLDPALDADPCPEPLRYLWHCFCELSAGRQSNGFGPCALSWGEIDSWARVSGRAPTGFELTALLLLDHCYLEAAGKKGKA